MLQETLKEWNRVIKLSRKPKRHEFITVVKITGIGMLLVGLVGFVIRMIIQILGITL